MAPLFPLQPVPQYTHRRSIALDEVPSDVCPWLRMRQDAYRNRIDDVGVVSVVQYSAGDGLPEPSLDRAEQRTCSLLKVSQTEASIVIGSQGLTLMKIHVALCFSVPLVNRSS
jgi:hypothetical protein